MICPKCDIESDRQGICDPCAALSELALAERVVTPSGLSDWDYRASTYALAGRGGVSVPLPVDPHELLAERLAGMAPRE